MRQARALLLVAALLVAHEACRDPSRMAQGTGRDAGPADGAAAAPPTGSIATVPAAPLLPHDSRADPVFAPEIPADDPVAARKTAFTIDSLYRLRQVTDPQWSPDATKILFTVASHTLSEAKTDVDVYLVNADGSGLRQMTRHEGPDTTVRWSPDGKSFLFLSSRGHDETQIWRMPIDGGEPTRLTNLSTGADHPEWTPDGQRVVFTSRVFPEHGADDIENGELLDDIEKSPFHAHVADHLLFRHWDTYADGRRTHILVLDIAAGTITDATPGDFDAPDFDAGGDHGFDVSPDASEICFASNREDPDARAWTTNKDLWVVPLSGGPARNITQDHRAYDGHPQYSPDGRSIAFLRQEKPGFEADRFRLVLFDRASGSTRVLTDSFDFWVEQFHWSADSKHIVFRSPVQGRFPLFRVDTTTGAVERVPGIPSVAEFDLSADGRLALTLSSVSRPWELYVSGLEAAGDTARVTSFHDAIANKVDLRPVEEMWVRGAGGRQVHVFVVKPHGFRKGVKYPTILNVHGGPQYQWADSFRGDWQVYPGAGYVVAFPNPHGSVGYGQEYTDAISKDWGGKVYDDVIAVADALAQLDYVDASRMGAMGWSYGGYMMAWLLGHTDRFRAIASMMGIYDLAAFCGSTEELWFPDWDVGGPPWTHADEIEKWSPSSFAQNFRTPTLILTGEKDYRIPYTQSVQLFTALRRQGVPARLIVFPNEGHWPRWTQAMPVYYAAHLDWFHRYLGGTGSPYDVEQMVRGRAFR